MLTGLLRDERTTRRILTAALVVGGLLMLRLVYVDALGPRYSDFGLGYTFARAADLFGWQHAYDTPWLSIERRVVQPNQWAPNVYTPWHMLLMGPFALLPLVPASILWTTMLLACALVTWHLLTPLRGLLRLVSLLVAMIMPQVQEIFWWQQIVGVVAFASAVSFRLARANRPLLAGVALGCAVSLKPQLVFVVPVALLAARQWRLMSGFVLTSVALAVIALAFFGFHGLRQGAINILFASAHLSSYNVRIGDSFLPLLPQPVKVATQLVIIAMPVIAVARARTNRLEIAYGGGIAASLLAAPYVHSVDWAMIVPAFAIAWPALKPAFGNRWVVGVTVAAALTTIALNLPVAILSLVCLAWLAVKREPDQPDDHQARGVARQLSYMPGST